MKKLAIVLDSFCGRGKKEIEKNKDHFYIPLKVYVDGKEFLDDGETYSFEEAMKLINKAKDVKTSQPSPATIEDTFKDLSEKYENVIYLSVGTPLSGTYQTASMIANEFKNVHVVDSCLVGKAFLELSDHLIDTAAKDIDIKDILKHAREYATESPTYVIPKNIDAFVRGGRLSRAVTAMLQKLKAVPIIGYEDTKKLHKKMVKRSGQKAVHYAVEKIVEFGKQNKKDYVYIITHTLDKELVDIAVKCFKEHKITPIVELATGIINAHVGDGAISIGLFEKIKPH